MKDSRILLALLLLLAPFSAASAQGGESEAWNSPRALELYDRARERRSTPHADSTLVSYAADATGYVYFYLDRRDTDERNLVKVDQVALEVYWAAPDRTKQRIVGLRDRSVLPNRMHYHLDHLTVVQDEFADVIRLGDGDEVRDVPHPAAAGGPAVYDYRLSDSLTLRLPGSPEPVRVYELQVRPRDFGRPAFVGSIYVDRARADIVRLAFTFTPSAYVDPRLDYIRIALDNGLWDGRYWLPHRQRVEIRRQLPELDFPAGAVIRGVMRIAGYRFNEELPDALFAGPLVTALPKSMREDHPFEDSLFAGLAAEGLDPAAELVDVEEHAARLVRDRWLSGLPRLRLHLRGASSVLRYDRAEGLFLGGGLSYALAPAARLEATAGYAFGAETLEATTALALEPAAGTRLRVEAFRGRLTDLQPGPAAAGVINTIAAAATGHDYLDPYRATGAALRAERRLGRRWTADATLAAERHESAWRAAERSPVGGAALRAVAPIDEGRLHEAMLGLRRPASRASQRDWGAALSLAGGTLGGDRYLRPTIGVETRHASVDRRLELNLLGSAGLALGDPPVQRLFYLGGRGTLPGYDFRAFAGDRYALARAEASRELLGPWLRLRALGAAGWVGAAGKAAAPGSDGARASLGLGVGLVHDILRLDLWRGLHDGGWRGILSVRPDLRGIL